MDNQHQIDLDQIAEEEATTVVGAISTANEMKLVNDQHDLHALIKMGILQALETMLATIQKQKGE
jgi:hypothetical protein